VYNYTTNIYIYIYITAILSEKEYVLDGENEGETLETESTNVDAKITKMMKQVLLSPGKVVSMSILLKEKSTFRKQNGLSGKALMEKVTAEIRKLSLGEVEVYNTTNRAKVHNKTATK
jgi:hypothetical protein